MEIYKLTLIHNTIMETCQLIIFIIAGVCWCGAEHVSSAAVVYGVEGQQATIRCPYGGSLKMNTKYVCSSTCSAKDGRIEVGGGGMERKGRLFLRDDNTSGVLTLTISRLTIEDSGEYTCVIKRRFWYDEKTKLRLIVSRLVTKTGFLGQSSSLTCKTRYCYLKYFCRGQEPATCAIITTMEGKTRDRFNLVDDLAQGTYTLTITNLSKGDSGIYWCVDLCRWRSIYTSPVQLFIRDEPDLMATSTVTIQESSTPPSLQLTSSSSSSSLSSTPSSSSSSTSTSTSTSTATSTATSSSSPSTSAPHMGVIMPVSVSLLTSLFVVGTVFFTFRRRHGNRGQGPNSRSYWRNTDTDIHNEMPDANYEDIADICQPPQPTLNTDYAMAQLPKLNTGYTMVQLPTLNTDYAMVQLPKLNTDYTMAQLPKSHSHLPEYSNTPLPTNPSDDTIYSNNPLPINPSGDTIYCNTPLPINPSRDTIYSNTPLPINPSSDTIYSNTPLPINPSGDTIYSNTPLPITPSDDTMYSNTR